MAKLNLRARKQLPKQDFAVPSKAPASGSFPINDPNHAKNALARSSGKPVAGQVKAAVKAKFPGIGQDQTDTPPNPDKKKPKKGGGLVAMLQKKKLA